VAEGWRDSLSAWEDLRVESVEEYRELDDERVLVLHDLGGRGKTSGLELGLAQTKAATLFDLRDGKVTRLVAYPDREQALADFGLEG
jgi:ketosteroid isomerase-like protein